MNKQVSPLFAIIVIVVVAALGALYFMVRYRAHEVSWQAESKALQQQAENARRMGRGIMGGNRPGRGMRRGMRRGPGGAVAPGGTRQPARPGASPGTERRGR